MKAVLPEVYRLDDYTAPQLLGGALRAGGSNGIVYDSVRQDNGRCIAAFRPRVLSHCKEQKHLRYVWNGERVSDVLEIRKL